MSDAEHVRIVARVCRVPPPDLPTSRGGSREALPHLRRRRSECAGFAPPCSARERRRPSGRGGGKRIVPARGFHALRLGGALAVCRVVAAGEASLLRQSCHQSSSRKSTCYVSMQAHAGGPARARSLPAPAFAPGVAQVALNFFQVVFAQWLFHRLRLSDELRPPDLRQGSGVRDSIVSGLLTNVAAGMAACASPICARARRALGADDLMGSAARASVHARPIGGR